MANLKPQVLRWLELALNCKDGQRLLAEIEYLERKEEVIFWDNTFAARSNAARVVK